MTTTNTPPPPAPDEPEEPTNRPAPLHLMRGWFERPYARRIIIIACIVGLLFIPVLWFVIWVMNTSGGPASAIMHEIELTMVVLTIASAPLMAFTLAVLLYSLFGGWQHMGGEKPPMQESPGIRTNGVGVTLWISVVSVLAAFLVVWGLVELAGITQYSYGSTPANQQPNQTKAIDINVTGQQWMWSFEYPDQGKITTDRLVVPINTPLYFNVTSKDVIHDFWVVEMGIKIDANPGAITNTGVTADKLGTFNVRCAELCGLHHAYMETEIEVVTQQEFDAWVREMGGGKTL